LANQKMTDHGREKRQRETAERNGRERNGVVCSFAPSPVGGLLHAVI
jgi:hypothetical protein